MKIKTAGDLIPVSAKPQGDGDTRQIIFPVPQYVLYNLFYCYLKRLEQTFSQFQDKNIIVT